VPNFADFVEKTVSFKLHDWQRNFLVPLLESLITGETLNIRPPRPPEMFENPNSESQIEDSEQPESEKPRSREAIEWEYRHLCPAVVTNAFQIPPNPVVIPAHYKVHPADPPPPPGVRPRPFFNSVDGTPMEFPHITAPEDAAVVAERSVVIESTLSEAKGSGQKAKSQKFPNPARRGKERSESGLRSKSRSAKRILIHAPPQYGKSILVSKRFPAWALGKNPLLRIVLAGYNESHASSFCEVVRDVMAGDTYREMFPNRANRIKKSASRIQFSTKARAKLRDSQHSLTAVGLLTGFTGKGADVLIIDDPYASPDDAKSKSINERVWRWWNELAKVRINDKTHVIVMFHRYHEDDFAGRLLAEGGWDYYRFPAIADENENGDDPTGRAIGELLSPIRSREFLQEFEDRDPDVWLGQFQGRPRKPEGTIIRREWLQEIPPSELPPLNYWVRFWDLATKAGQTGDFIAGALVAVGPDQTIYVKDITRFRAEWPDARDIIAGVTKDDVAICREARARYEVGVEEVAWQRPMLHDLFTQKTFYSTRLLPVKPKGDKKERASGWFARAKQGKFKIVKGHWNSDFIKECLAFDGLGLTHDDQVDAVSGAYNLLWDLRGALVETRPVVQEGSLRYYQLLRQSNPPRDGFGNIIRPPRQIADDEDDPYPWAR